MFLYIAVVCHMQMQQQKTKKFKKNYTSPEMKKISLVRREHLLLSSKNSGVGNVLPVVIEDD